MYDVARRAHTVTVTSTDPRPRRRRIALLLTPGLVVVAVAAYAVVSLQAGQHIRGQLTSAPAVTATPPVPGPMYRIGGNIRLKAGEYVAQGKTCRSLTIPADAQVVLTDGDGVSLGYAGLRAGKLADGHCDLPFTAELPVGKGSYGVDVPHWGLMTYTEQELADTIELTFG